MQNALKIINFIFFKIMTHDMDLCLISYTSLIKTHQFFQLMVPTFVQFIRIYTTLISKVACMYIHG